MAHLMETLKNFIAKKLVGSKFRFTCDCIVPLDVVGVVKDFEILNNEIIYLIDVGGKIIKIGENHPNLMIEEL